MRLSKLTLHDFLSHNLTVITFGENQKVLINGRSGSGKTAIVEAIIWCLFGKGRLDNRDLVRHGETSGYVDLELIDGNNKWGIRRRVTSKGSQTLDISLENGTKAIPVPATTLKEKQDFIEKKILQCSYELFTNSVVYPQDNGQNFVKQTAARRKELLLEIIGAIDFDDYADRARQTSLEIQSEITSTDAQITTNNQSVARMRDTISDGVDPDEIERLEKEAEKMKAEISKREEEAKKAEEARIILQQKVDAQKEASLKKAIKEKRLSEIENLLSGSEKIKGEIEDVTEKLKIFDGKLDEQIDELEKVKTETSQAEAKKAVLDIKLSSAEAKIADTKAAIKALLERKTSLPIPESDICPATGKPCVRVQKMIDEQLKAISNEINTATENLSTHMAQVISIKKEVEELVVPKFDNELLVRLKVQKIDRDNLLRRRYDLQKKLDDFAGLSKEKDIITAELADIADLLTEDASEYLVRATEIASEASKLLETSRSTLSELERLLGRYKALQETIKQTEKQIAEIEEVVQVLEKKKVRLTNDLECVKLIREAFGANGMKIVVIDTVLPNLEKRINEILSELSEFRIKLDTQKDKATTDGKKEGLFITIINDQEEEMDFDGYSGGEKLKIIVAISEALAELQRAEFRIIDELFIGLDDESVSQFGEVLLRLQERFSQVLCISHIPQIKELFEDVVEVKKMNGKSVCIQ